MYLFYFKDFWWKSPLSVQGLEVKVIATDETFADACVCIFRLFVSFQVDFSLQTMADQQKSPHPGMIRRESVMSTVGKEGQQIANGAWAGNVIGVFTSGGDSQGKPLPVPKCRHRNVWERFKLP